MRNFEPEVATAVIGLAAFELWKVWNDTAPSIDSCRKASLDDGVTRQHLYDADIVVGTLAVIIGTAYAVLAKDMSVLIILVVIFGALSFFHHFLINNNPVS